MTIILTSNDITDFDPQEAIEMWLTSGLRQRRPTYMDEDTSNESEDIVCVGLASIGQEMDDTV